MTEPLSTGGAAAVDRRRRVFHHLLADMLAVPVVRGGPGQRPGRRPGRLDRPASVFGDPETQPA